MISVNIKLIGDLSGLSKMKSLKLEVPESAMINDVIQELVKIVNKEEFKRTLIDEITGSINPNIIVLLNGREVKTLGLNSRLKDNDEIVLIPATHGG